MLGGRFAHGETSCDVMSARPGQHTPFPGSVVEVMPHIEAPIWILGGSGEI